MDKATLVSSIQQELETQKENKIALLSLQNHIYGCFIVMEDIVQGVLDLDEGNLVGNAFHLNLESQFPQIGIRYYGFVMDGKAIFDCHSMNYKETWITLFNEIHRVKDMDQVDELEDQIIQLLQSVKRGDSYFLNALEHDGNLSPDWVEQALYVLHPTMTGLSSVSASASASSVLSLAKSDKAMVTSKDKALNISKKVKSVIARNLSTTRRQRPIGHSSVKHLATTRRVLK